MYLHGLMMQLHVMAGPDARQLGAARGPHGGHAGHGAGGEARAPS